jgi:hypothetical protein
MTSPETRIRPSVRKAVQANGEGLTWLARPLWTGIGANNGDHAILSEAVEKALMADKPRIIDLLLNPPKPVSRRALREHDYDTRKADQNRQRRFLDALLFDRPSGPHKPD